MRYDADEDRVLEEIENLVRQIEEQSQSEEKEEEKPEPVKPEPVKPEPVKPEPVLAKPVKRKRAEVQAPVKREMVEKPEPVLAKREERRVYNDVIEKGAMAASRRRKSQEDKASGKKNYLQLGILIVCLLVFLVAASQLVSIFGEYKEGADTYKSMQELALQVPDVETNHEVTYDMYYVDFEELLNVNEDTVGWIRFDEPEVINYPLVQSYNNDEYLVKTFEGVSNMVGTLFLDETNTAGFNDSNTIIYGHNMKDNSMFGDLAQYTDEEYYKEHPYFYIYTPDGMASKYQIAAAETVDATDLARYSTNFASGTEYQEYINYMLSHSFYDTGASVTTSSKLVTLSTCTNDVMKRFIVQAVKIEEKEMVKTEIEEL